MNTRLPIFAAILAALLTWIGTLLIEQRKEVRALKALALVLQAELTRIRLKLLTHHHHLEGYATRMANRVSEGLALEYQPFEMTDDDMIYRQCVNSIGVFEERVTYDLVHCFGNIRDFLAHEDAFIKKLPGISNSDSVGREAGNLDAAEKALIKQIERLVPTLTWISSQPLPFDSLVRFLTDALSNIRKGKAAIQEDR